MIAAVTGCKDPPPTAVSPAPPLANVTLRVVVVEDAALAAAISRLRGEWSEQTGGHIEVVDFPGAPDAGSLGVDAPDTGEAIPPGDLLVFPSRRLGELCEANKLRAIRESTLVSDQLAFNDFFPLIRDRVIVYGQQVMALPLGCPIPLLARNASGDGRRPGASSPGAVWSGLTGRLGYSPPAAEDEQRAAYEFLARTACYATHPSRQALLFDPKTMAPRLGEPPHVRALGEMTASGPQPSNGAGKPSAGALLQPNLGGVIFWPGRAASKARDGQEAANDIAAPLRLTPEAAETMRVTPLPGAREHYSPIARSWEPIDGPPQRASLLATSGRLVGVTASSRNATSGFRLAAWLAGSENSRRLSTASRNVANTRLSSAGAPDDWSASGLSSLGRQFANAHRQAMQSRHSLVVPRILRIDDYLEALGTAILGAEEGAMTAEEALRKAAADWEDLTEQVGRDRQRSAYQRHLGIAGYTPASK